MACVDFMAAPAPRKKLKAYRALCKKSLARIYFRGFKPIVKFQAGRTFPAALTVC